MTFAYTLWPEMWTDQKENGCPERKTHRYRVGCRNPAFIGWPKMSRGEPAIIT